MMESDTDRDEAMIIFDRLPDAVQLEALEILRMLKKQEGAA